MPSQAKPPASRSGRPVKLTEKAQYSDSVCVDKADRQSKAKAKTSEPSDKNKRKKDAEDLQARRLHHESSQRQEAKEREAASQLKKSAFRAAPKGVGPDDPPARRKDPALTPGRKLVVAPPTPNPTPAPAPARKAPLVTYHLVPPPPFAPPRRTKKPPTMTQKPPTSTKKTITKKLPAPVPAKTVRAESPVDAAMASDDQRDLDAPSSDDQVDARVVQHRRSGKRLRYVASDDDTESDEPVVGEPRRTAVPQKRARTEAHDAPEEVDDPFHEAADDNDDDDDSVEVGTGPLATSKGKPKCSDYDGDAHTVIVKACISQRIIIATIDAFPTLEVRCKMYRLAFEAAGRHENITTVKYGRQFELILSYRPAQLRSEVKRAARDAVIAAFGLTKHVSPRDLTRNRKKVKDYMDTSKGAFQNRAILDIIVNVWFKSANDEGPVYSEEFNPIPKALFALVLTAMRDSIMEFSTGNWTPRPFAAKVNAMDYRATFNTLTAFEEECERMNSSTWKDIAKRTFTKAMDSTGGLPVAAIVAPADPSSFHTAIHAGYVDSDDDATDAGDNEDDTDHDVDLVEEAHPREDGSEEDGSDDGQGADVGPGSEAADDDGEDGEDGEGEDADGGVEEAENDDNDNGSAPGSDDDVAMATPRDTPLSVAHSASLYLDTMACYTRHRLLR